MSRIGKAIEIESCLVDARDCGEGAMVTANGYRVFLGGDYNVTELDDGCTTL